MRFRNLTQRFLWIIGLTFPLVWQTAGSARAQTDSLADWQEKAKGNGYAEPLKTEPAQFTALGAALHDGQWANQGDDQLFADFYQKRIFPLITHADTRGQRNDVVAKLRSDFNRLSAKPGPVLDKLIEITLGYMQPIAKDAKWHPSVRENAILAIGEVKSPKAVDALVELLKTRDLHPMFKVAAMAGLVRLAERDPLHPTETNVLEDPQVNPPVVALMVICASANQANAPDYMRWMRGQAADVLGAIGSVGAGKVPVALLTMIADKQLPLMQRAKAARALGRLDYTNGPLEADKFVQPLAEFGRDALAENLSGDARRIRSIALAFVGDSVGAPSGKKDAGALGPLEQAGAPGAVKQMRAAMNELLAAAKSKLLPEEKIKPAVAKAKAAFDAAAGKK